MPTLFDSHQEFTEWFSKDIESHAENKSALNERTLPKIKLHSPRYRPHGCVDTILGTHRSIVQVAPNFEAIYVAAYETGRRSRNAKEAGN